MSAASRSPPTVRFLSGFQQGVASVNPAAEVTVSWVGAFDDPTPAGS